MKEFKVEIPEGYEIDKEKSTFEKIVFKKKEVVNCWKDIEQITGKWIDPSSNFIDYPTLFIPMSACNTNKNVFLNEKYAKSALALAQISQLLPYYDSVDGCKVSTHWLIHRHNQNIKITQIFSISADWHLLCFKSKEEAERFLKYNEQLIKDYYML